MLISEMLKKVSVGDEVYVLKPLNIKWKTMRFESTNILFATYVVEQHRVTGLCLQAKHRPKGMLSFPTTMTGLYSEYQCFFTQEEAEVWKVVELQSLEDKVERHIAEMREKTLNKLKKLKQKEKLEHYLQKYPEHFIKVL